MENIFIFAKRLLNDDNDQTTQHIYQSYLNSQLNVNSHLRKLDHYYFLIYPFI